MNITALLRLSLLCLSLIQASGAIGLDYNIYVAEKASPAYEIATSKADGKLNHAERSMQKALNTAATLAAGGHAITIMVAGGEYGGAIGSGTLNIPKVSSPQGRIYLLGGWNSDFTTRNPFQHLSRIITQPGRGGAILEVGQKSLLAELVISGFVLDARPSNRYDGSSNLTKTGTSTYRLISLGYLKTNSLIIADNVFVNAPQVVLEPYISPLSNNASVEISNNFFINNVIPIQELSGVPVGDTLSTIKLLHNSFILSWPYNPDPTSSNVGAVGLYHKGGVKQVVIEGNMFAYNVGGAFQHDWPETRMPKISFRDNLFYQNAALFDKSAPGDGVIVGKFGTNPRYAVLDIEMLEDEMSYAASGNVTTDPGINITQALTVEIDEEDSYADHYIEGYAPPMDVDVNLLPFAQGEAERYGVSVNRIWQKR